MSADEVGLLIAQARSRKAVRLAAGARDRRITADAAALLDRAGRDALAGLVGVRSPSDETWWIVVDLLRVEHDVGRDDARGVTTIVCTGDDGHRWSVTASAPADIAWADAALAAHHGNPDPRFAVLARPCHPSCYDADGHTDGCLYDDGLD